LAPETVAPNAAAVMAREFTDSQNSYRRRSL